MIIFRVISWLERVLLRWSWSNTLSWNFVMNSHMIDMWLDSDIYLLLTSQQIFPLTLWYCVLSGKTANTRYTLYSIWYYCTVLDACIEPLKHHLVVLLFWIAIVFTNCFISLGCDLWCSVVLSLLVVIFGARLFYLSWLWSLVLGCFISLGCDTWCSVVLSLLVVILGARLFYLSWLWYLVLSCLISLDCDFFLLIL